MAKIYRTFPDLINPDPTREKIDQTNVVMKDLADELIEVSKAINRFEATAESRFGMKANGRIDALITRCNYLKRRINDIRRSIGDHRIRD